MPKRTVFIATLLAMLAFAANSVLCRVALERTAIDPASFTAIRLISGAAMLWILAQVRSGDTSLTGNWTSALALFAYAAGFSFAYVNLPTATGALLLFGAVQVTMLAGGVRAGERFSWSQVFGYLLALAGLAGLLMPGVSAPPLAAAALMLGAGVAWGIYSLRGKGQGDAICATAGNFLRTVPITLVLLIAMLGKVYFDITGIWLAIASGALASGIGYAIWYSALPVLRATTAATVQLSVPPIAALGGAAFLSEPLTLRWLLASVAILGGIALVTLRNATTRA